MGKLFFQRYLRLLPGCAKLRNDEFGLGIAASVLEASGKIINYNSPTPVVFQNTLKEYGVPEAYIGLFVAFAIAQANGELELYNNSLEQFLGRKSVTTRQFLTKLYAS